MEKIKSLLAKRKILFIIIAAVLVVAIIGTSLAFALPAILSKPENPDTPSGGKEGNTEYSVSVKAQGDRALADIDVYVYQSDNLEDMLDYKKTKEDGSVSFNLDESDSYAVVLANVPKGYSADEPTTALDVTIQAQILDLLRELKTKIDGSIMLITHDLGIIAEMADYVVVMYAGKVIEKGTVAEIFHNPLHPYTIGLQKSKPTINSDSETLFNIPGNVPNPINMPTHCYFKERCSRCTQKCSGDYPDMIQVSPTHFVACHLYSEEK